MGAGRHLATWIYKSIRDLSNKPLLRLRTQWEDEFKRQLHDGEWETALEFPKKLSRKARFKNIQFYILHKAYQTPARLQRFYPDTTILCPRCHSPDAQFQHMFWSCPTLNQYWAAILTSIKEITGLPDIHTWEAVALGIFRRPKTHKVHTRFASLALLLAKRGIAMKRRAPTGPAIEARAGAVNKWVAAEEEALREEEVKGHRKHPYPWTGPNYYINSYNHGLPRTRTPPKVSLQSRHLPPHPNKHRTSPPTPHPKLSAPMLHSEKCDPPP